jgi:hypothetical protein
MEYTQIVFFCTYIEFIKINKIEYLFKSNFVPQTEADVVDVK